MTIMMEVSGENVWTEDEGKEITPEMLLGVLMDNEIDDDTAYKAIGSALVNVKSHIYTKECVICISIIY